MMQQESQGIFLLDKPEGKSSFFLVKVLRSITNIKKIGHAGTLDPFATGLMVMLVGSQYTRIQSTFLGADKAYSARVELGKSTDSYDCTGKVVSTNSLIPSLSDLETALLSFQGTILQTPPMFSAKKIGGKRLYTLARKGEKVHREPVKIHLETKLINYAYPFVDLDISCSKGTYIRSIADDLGKLLGTGALLSSLRRTRSGCFSLKDAITLETLSMPNFSYQNHLREAP